MLTILPLPDKKRALKPSDFGAIFSVKTFAEFTYGCLGIYRSRPNGSVMCVSMNVNKFNEVYALNQAMQLSEYRIIDMVNHPESKGKFFEIDDSYYDSLINNFLL